MRSILKVIYQLKYIDISNILILNSHLVELAFTCQCEWNSSEMVLIYTWKRNFIIYQNKVLWIKPHWINPVPCHKRIYILFRKLWMSDWNLFLFIVSFKEEIPDRHRYSDVSISILFFLSALCSTLYKKLYLD